MAPSRSLSLLSTIRRKPPRLIRKLATLPVAPRTTALYCPVVDHPPVRQGSFLFSTSPIPSDVSQLARWFRVNTAEFVSAARGHRLSDYPQHGAPGWRRILCGSHCD